ncbi:uncharacterized protein BCR38DRAFT_478339 [Pseudomassariella vexata]|uniref:Rhodopsin domain-containing protein n=1 Tax=Pseudomassariella vexata TaxID=1141098 RepID=A0A1Y2DDD9_9PEZI|nr:uncharacterized protein BCR38DRAFT_478339 [Pseudomassariella vexata]ORY57136.1 hypothetical protein BCR38DRAFT_478339 [Pseudomassariella vexata]
MDTDAESRRAQVIVCAIAAPAVSFLLVALRFLTRGYVQGQVHVEDWCILVSLLFSIGATVGVFEQVKYGVGFHRDTLTGSQVSGFIMSLWYDILFYSLSLFFAKVSILLLYRRFLTFKTIAFLIKIALGLVTILYLYILVTLFIACIPLTSLWTWAVDGEFAGKCLPATVYWGNAAIGNSTDVLIVCLPMAVVFKLQLPFRRKLALTLTFSLVISILVISAFRLVYMKYVLKYVDFTANTTIIILSLVEINIAIVCACLPTLKPLFVYLFSNRSPNPNPDSSPKKSSDVEAGNAQSFNEARNGPINKNLTLDTDIRRESAVSSHPSEAETINNFGGSIEVMYIQEMAYPQGVKPYSPTASHFTVDRMRDSAILPTPSSIRFGHLTNTSSPRAFKNSDSMATSPDYRLDPYHKTNLPFSQARSGTQAAVQTSSERSWINVRPDSTTSYKCNSPQEAFFTLADLADLTTESAQPSPEAPTFFKGESRPSSPYTFRQRRASSIAETGSITEEYYRDSEFKLSPTVYSPPGYTSHQQRDSGVTDETDSILARHYRDSALPPPLQIARTLSALTGSGEESGRIR